MRGDSILTYLGINSLLLLDFVTWYAFISTKTISPTKQGYWVGVWDTGSSSPDLHVLFSPFPFLSLLSCSQASARKVTEQYHMPFCRVAESNSLHFLKHGNQTHCRWDTLLLYAVLVPLIQSAWAKILFWCSPMILKGIFFLILINAHVVCPVKVIWWKNFIEGGWAMFASLEFHHKWLECVRHDVQCISISPWIKLTEQTLCWSTWAVIPPFFRRKKHLKVWRASAVVAGVAPRTKAVRAGRGLAADRSYGTATPASSQKHQFWCTVGPCSALLRKGRLKDLQSSQGERRRKV